MISETPITVNINGIQYQNMDEMTEAIAVKLLGLIKREEKAYA